MYLSGLMSGPNSSLVTRFENRSTDNRGNDNNPGLFTIVMTKAQKMKMKAQKMKRKQ